jgi:hypothetical protein
MWRHHNIKIPRSKKNRGENVSLAFFTPIFRAVVGLEVVVTTTPVVGKTVVPGVVVIPDVPVALLLAGVLLAVGRERLGF